KSAASNAVVQYGTPVVPSNVSASLGSNNSGRANVSWSASSDFRGPGPYYRVRDNGGAVQNAGNSTSHAFTGLSNGTAYTFQVQPCNQYVCSAWSTTSGSVTPYTTPGSPGISTIKFADNQGRFHVSASSSNGGRTIQRIEWEYTRGASGSGRATSWSFTKDTPKAFSTTYTLRARACNEA